MGSEQEDPITLEYQPPIAVITLTDKTKLNALNADLYYHLGNLLREIATKDDIYVTLLIGKGRYFSAGADVSVARSVPEGAESRRHWLQTFVSNNLDVTRAFYSHPKILVTGMNGPAIGLSAALIAFSDFIYATPKAFILTPFSSLGLVAEGGSSHAFVQRLGIAKANEALIMSKRITADELLRVGFVNEIFDTGDDDARFREKVLVEIKSRLGSHLNPDSLLRIKALIRKPETDILDRQNMVEVLSGLERFTTGVPQREFRRIADGEKKHKL